MKYVNAILLVINFHASSAFFQASKSIHTLDTASYNTLVRQTSTVWLVDFYAPWCPHCRHFAPQYEKVARAFASSNIKIGAVDCVQESSICDDEKIDRYPSIQLLQVHRGTAEPRIFQMRRFSDFRDVIDWVVEQCVKDGIDTGAVNYAIPSGNLDDGGAEGGNQTAIVPLEDSIQLKYARLCEAGATALYTLENSIFLGSSSLSTETYEAALNWMEALAASFPLEQNRAALGKLLTQYKTRSTWVKSAWRKIFFAWRAEAKATMFPLGIFDLVKEGTKGDGSASIQQKSDGKRWRNCQTFTCGLWTLFHSMTVGVRYKDCKLRPSQVAVAIHTFIEHFFGCEECVEHFLKENPPAVMSQLQKSDDDGGEASIIWLWDMHNAVNERTEKAFWPPSSVCKTCYIETDEVSKVNETSVVSYMVASYQQLEGDVWSLRYNVEGVGGAVRGSISKRVRHYLLLLSAVIFLLWVVYLLLRSRRHNALHFLKSNRTHIA
uniref:Sulfhydryl oxidase n=1 Tax=Albugo laibachii Nc14 TaxID=890382 RepID=F0WDA9_9STRA|nr:sulfhydryl oxidase putative [Albugo laibachii Nc14]|eukprot:CCA19181.1 sulfhydryl oxidase putative [Albugo laibachii Nc14]